MHADFVAEPGQLASPGHAQTDHLVTHVTCTAQQGLAARRPRPGSSALLVHTHQLMRSVSRAKQGVPVGVSHCQQLLAGSPHQEARSGGSLGASP